MAGQRRRWLWNSSWCYRFGPAPEFLDSCQSPGSVSFRQPIRGVVTARSPSLIPRCTDACFEFLSVDLGWSSWGSSKSQQFTRDFFVFPLPLAAGPMLSRPFAPQPISIASLAFSCLPFAACTYDLKYITGYKSILDAVGCFDRQRNLVDLVNSGSNHTCVFSSDPLRSTEICVIGQMRYDRIDEWSIDRVIDDWNEQKIYFHGLESRSHEPRLFNVLSTRINLDRKVRLTLWKNKSCFKIKYVHLTGITDSPFREFRTPIYRIDYVNVKVPFSKVITRLPRVLRMIFKMNKHFIFSRTKNRRTSFNTNIHSWQSLVIRLINSD